jgi:hypothetical protein
MIEIRVPGDLSKSAVKVWPLEPIKVTSLLASSVAWPQVTGVGHSFAADRVKRPEPSIPLIGAPG